MFKKPLTRAARLRAQRDEARIIAEGLQQRLCARGAALREIVSSVDSITTPNGTLRKVRRIAREGLGG